MSDAPVIFDRSALIARQQRYANDAEKADFLLHRVADDLAERLALVTRTFANGLNIDAYHGVLSRRLRQLPNVGAVLDASATTALLSRCDGPTVTADLEALPFTEPTFDLVVSGLSLHLVNDVPGALIQLRRAMTPDGLLLAAMLGGETLRELRESWLVAEADLFDGASPRVAPFADVRTLGGLLQRAGFALPVADAQTVTVTYTDPLALMRDVKAMGASNMLHDRSRRPVTRRLLARACQIYADRFPAPGGRIKATFEIVTLTAWVPHESQPKPLRPGSAAMRLADALAGSSRKPNA